MKNLLTKFFLYNIFLLMSLCLFPQPSNKIEYKFSETHLYLTSISVKLSNEDVYIPIYKHHKIHKLLKKGQYRVRHSYKKYLRMLVRSKITFLIISVTGCLLITSSSILCIVGYPLILISGPLYKTTKSNAYYYLEDAIDSYNKNNQR